MQLFRALESNTTLTNLHMRWNSVGLGGLGMGPAAFGKMIAVNKVGLGCVRGVCMCMCCVILSFR